MSKTIDERVVEMRFDNRNFESNVQTSMSTLDKLKEKLNFKNSSKSLENLNGAAKKVNLSGLSGAVETVHARFSALEVMGVTALANITNSAVNAGKRIVDALTFEPVRTGFQEYETQINAIQTILANTESKGTTLKQVTAALDELNTYADKTIYNFTEMTRNIGTFTAAGVDLDTSVKAIQGIANLAAVSGSTSQQASVAMYQLSQALAAGTVKLMDWNSVVNAGMGGQVFQDALKETARVHGIAIDQMIKDEGSFRETLSQGWITSEILTETLEKFTMTTEGLTESEIANNRERLKSIGYTDEQINSIFKLGTTATNAATKVKTFTQLWDVLKESAQSGWTKSWQIIIGDFEESKTLWTSVSDSVTGMINKMSDARNDMLEKALGDGSSKWSKLAEEINKAGIATDDFQKALIKTARKHNISIDQMIKDAGSFEETLESGWLTTEILVETIDQYTNSMDGMSESTDDAAAKLEKFQKVVADVWYGTYDNSAARVEKLTKAGYDYAEVQALVNKTVNDHKLDLEDLSDAQLKNAGYTETQIRMLKELAAEAENSGSSLSQLIEEMSRPSGRSLLLDSFKNFGEEFGKIITAIKEAWNEIFGEVDASEMLYSFIERLHELSEAFNISEDSAENFKTVCEGAFAVFQLGTSLFSLSLVSGLKILAAVLEVFGTNLLEVSAIIADYIIKFRDWINENTIFINSFDKIGKILETIIKGIQTCIDAFLGLKVVKQTIEDVKNAITDFFNSFNLEFKGFSIDKLCELIESAFSRLADGIKSLDNSKMIEYGRNIVDGLVIGIRSGISDAVAAISAVGQAIISAICGVLGINSPSTVMIGIGKFIIIGLVIGVLAMSPELLAAVKGIFSQLIDLITTVLDNLIPTVTSVVKNIFNTIKEAAQTGSIDWSAIFVAGSIVAIIVLLNKLLKVADKLVSPLKGLGDGLKGLFNAKIDELEAKKIERYSNAIRNIALSIGILAASIALLSKMDIIAVWSSVGAILVLTAALAGITALAAKIDPKQFIGFGGLSIFLLSMSASLLIMSSAMKKLSTIDVDGAKVAIAQMVAIFAGLSLLMAAYGSFVKGKAAANIGKAGTMLLGMAAGFAIIAVALKIIAGLSQGDINKALTVVTAMSVIFAGIIAVSTLAGKNADRAGYMLKKMAVAIAILALSMKLIASMSGNDIAKGLIVIAGISAIFAGLIAVSALAGPNAAKAGAMFWRMAIAIGILSVAMKLIATMSANDINKGIHTIASLGILFAAFSALSLLIGSEHIDKAGVMFMKMGIAIGILALAIKLISTLSANDIAKGLTVIAAIELLCMAMVRISEFSGANADKAGAMLMKMSIAILILVGAIALLSLLDPKDVAVGTAAIVSVLAMFALIVKATQYSKDCMKTLVVMSVAIGILAGTLIALSFLDPTHVATAGAAISALVGMFALLVAATKYAQKAIDTIIVLTLAVGALAGILALMSSLPIESTLASSAALSMLILAISASFRILATVASPLVKPALAGLAGMVVAVGLLVGLFAVIDHFDIGIALETAKSLSILLIAIAEAMAIAGIVGMVPVTALEAGLIAFGVFIIELIAIFGGVSAGLGALQKYIFDLETFLNTGIPILEKIGYAIGSFFGNIRAGFIENSGSSLVVLADNLSAFMEHLQPFLTAASNVDASIAEGVKNIAAAILMLTGANFLESITSFFTGGSSIADFAKQLVPLGVALSIYSKLVENVNAEAISASGKALKALAEAAETMPNEGGLLSFFTGENNIAEFASNLPKVGAALSEYSASLTGVNAEAISASGRALKAMAEAAEEIPSDGGFWEKITGANDMVSFAEQLKELGPALSEYATSVSGITNIDAISNSAKAIKAIAEVAEEIPNDGGMFGDIVGNNSIGDFGSKLAKLGVGLKLYSTTVADLNIEAINKSVQAAKRMVAIAQMIPSDGLTGTDGIDDFGRNLVTFGKKLKTFAETVSDIDVSGINTIGPAIKKLTSSVSGLKNIDDGIGKKLTSLSSSIKKFVSSLSGVKTGSIGSIASELKKLSSATKSITTFSNALKTAGTTSMQSFVKSIQSGVPKVRSAVTQLMTALVNGIKSKQSTIVSTCNSMMNRAASAIRNKRSSFYSAGAYAAAGAVGGIRSKKQSVYNEGYNLGLAGVQGYRAAMQINSPSKVMYKLGLSTYEGLAKAYKDSAGALYKDSYSYAENAKKGLTKALSMMADAIDSDIDVQPTIRPVIDLSDVERGANSINGMFGMTPSVGLMSNIGAINSIMGAGQNGVNDDVISAIKDLGRKLGSISGDTYHIDGITYDDGSNVSEAIKTLVRAARVERRM